MDKYTHRVLFDVITPDKNDWEWCNSAEEAERFKDLLENNPLIRNIRIEAVEKED